MNPSTIQTDGNRASDDAGNTDATNIEGPSENVYAELLVSIDIESVVVSAGGFIARTKEGGSVSISRSKCQELTITKLQSGARPPSYVGRAPYEPYLALLREMHAPALAEKQQKH